MSVQNGERLATKQDLADMYQEILPYLGGSADAGFTPVGSIIPIMGVTAPANYLACNGQIVNVADYPELATYFEQQFGTKYKFGGSGTTFGIPDLRGQFLRGTGTNSDTTQGSGSAVGTRQKATRHSSPKAYGYSGGKVRFFYELPSNPSSDGWANRAYEVDKSLTATPRYTYAPAQTTTTAYSAGTEEYAYTSRPTNTSVLFCIATKNIYMNPALDYTTEEKVVGQWIDGKALYQRTYTAVKADFSNQEGHIPHNISNLDSIVSFNGIAIDSTSSHLKRPLCFSYTSSSDTSSVAWYAGVYIGVNDIVLQMGSSFYNNLQSVIVTIQYTKTTT